MLDRPGVTYRREIDGLRAIAVVPVILFHGGFSLFRGGFVGVDVFFVISGYLIASILIDDIHNQSFSLAKFYERRARRILPALFFIMIVCVPFAWFWMLPLQLKDFGQSMVAVSVFMSNVLFWTESGYFSSGAELKPLLHTWSLAVEEQFYLLFPLYILFAFRKGKRGFAFLTIAIALASLALSEWGWRNAPAANFFLLPGRIWELLAGSLCAVINEKPNARNRKLWSIVGLSMITYSVFGYDARTPSPSVFTLMPVLGTCLIITFASHETPVGKLLSTKPLVFLGLISYSAYLWHQPLLAFARIRTITPSQPLMLSLCGLSIILATLTWMFIERPFRSRGVIPWSRSLIFGVSATAIGGFVAVGISAHLTGGFVQRFPSDYMALLSFQESYDLDFQARYPEQYKFIGDCFLEETEDVPSFVDACLAERPSKGVAIWGDSHAMALAAGALANRENVRLYSASGCPPLLDIEVYSRPNCQSFNDSSFADIVDSPPDILLIHANWIIYMSKDWGVLRDMDDLSVRLAKTIDVVGAALVDTQIYVVGLVPQWETSLPDVMVLNGVSLGKEKLLPNNQFDEFLMFNQSISETIAKKDNIKFVDPMSVFCTGGYCAASVRFDTEIWPTAFDYGHLTRFGASLLFEEILPTAGCHDGGSCRHVQRVIGASPASH